MNAEIIKSKTFWAAVTAIIGVIGAVMMGQMTWVQSVTPILSAVLGIFIKDAVVTASKAS